jgi:alpha(1,3/1,4) fucosyltransferase
MHQKIEYLKNRLQKTQNIVFSFVNGGEYFKDLIISIFKQTLSNIRPIIYVYPDIPFETDILVSSTFGNETPNVYYMGLRVYTSGEAHDLSTLTNYDIIIDTKTERKLLPKNIPLLYVPFYVNSLYERFNNNINDLLANKNHAKTKFAAYLYNECHKHREEIFDKISAYKKVDALGKCRELVVNGTCQNIETDRFVYTDKITYNDLAVKKYFPYKFVLALENANCEGYITEKIINPMLAGCIPIYWGSSKIKEHFNEKSFIYINDYKNLDDLVAYIKKVDTDDVLYNSYIQQSYFKDNQLNEYILENPNNVTCTTLKNLFKL